MGFKVSNGSVNINVNTFSNFGGNNKNTFKLNSYDDIGEIDYSQYAPVQQNVDFSVSADNLRFERAQLADIYTWKDFALDLIAFREQVKEFDKKVCATLANVTVSLVEGLVSFGEAIVDCAALLVGAVATIGTGLWDIGVGIFTGNWDWSATGAMWKEGFMPFIGYDATSSAFDWIYEKTPMKAVDDAAFDWGKRGGTVYSIGKGVGYYTGMIVLTTVTCGASAGAVGATSASTAASTQLFAGVTVKTVAQAGAGFAGSLGKNTQKNYNTAVAAAQAEGREVTGSEIFGSIAKATGTAAIDGGIYFAAGAVGDYFKATDNAIKFAKNNDLPLNISDAKLKALQWGIKHKDGLVVATKASKAYLSEGYNCLLTGEEYDFGSATSDAISIVVAETVALKMKNILYQAPKDSAPKVEAPKVIENVEANADIGELSSGLEGTKEAAVETLRTVTAKEVFKFSIQTGFAKGEEKLVKEVTSTVVESIPIGGDN